VQWFDTPHLPHAWECGFVFEQNACTEARGVVMVRN
jgi:hypothetical protein